MKCNVTIVFYFLFTACIQGQDLYDSFVAEIAALKDTPAIKNYWNDVHSADQRYRGIDAIDSNDCNNLVKVVSLIEHFGYPDPKIYGQVISSTPILVMVHQNSIQASSLPFPMVYRAYKDRMIELGDIIYFLSGLHHAKFGQFFDRDRGPHKHDPKDVGRLRERLQLDTTLDQKINVIDVFRKEKADRKKDRMIDVIGRWRANATDKYICFQKGNRYFLKLLYQDHSFCEPEMTLRKEQGETILEYAQSFYGDYFKITKTGDLEYYEKGALKKVFIKT